MMLDLGYWYEVKDGDHRVVALYERHYSADPRTSHSNRLRYGVSGVGESMVLLTPAYDAAFIWVRNTTERYDGQQGVQCSFFRNEGRLRSSDLIREASCLAWERWSGERLWTYVDPEKTKRRRSKHKEPGACFIEAGWTLLPEPSAGGLRVLELLV